MANIVVTSTADSIKVVFNIYSTALGMEEGTWNKAFVKNFMLRPTLVAGIIDGELEWLLSHDGATGTFQVDTINGATPTSNSDLYDKLIALIA